MPGSDHGRTVEAANKASVSAFMDAVQKGDIRKISDAYAEDGICETTGRTLISGRFDKQQVTVAAGRVLEAFPDGIAFEILTMTAEEDRVAVEARSSARHISGQAYANHYHFLFRFRDGKIVLMQEFMDTEIITDIICGGQRPAPLAEQAAG